MVGTVTAVLIGKWGIHCYFFIKHVFFDFIIQKTNVGGVTSHGMFCDESMLRWGNTKNKAIRMPENIELGSRPTRLPPNTIK